MPGHRRFVRLALLITVVALTLAGLSPGTASAVSTSARQRGAADVAPHPGPEPGFIRIQGLVRDAARFLDNINVEVLPAGEPTAGPVASALTYASPWDPEEPHGYYEMDVPSDGSYVVRFSTMPGSDPAYGPIYWGGGDGRVLDSTDGAVDDLGVTTFNQGEIDGLVQDAGRFIDNINVEAVPADDPTGEPVASALTYASPDREVDPHGFFRLQVPPGDYLIRYSSLGDATWPYATQMYGGGEGTPVTVGDQESRSLDTVTLVREATPTLTAHVTSSSGSRVAHPVVEVFSWTGDAGSGGWDLMRAWTGNEQGDVHVPLPADSTLTFRILRSGFEPVVYGGGTELPSVPTGSDSVTTGADDDVNLGAVQLTPRSSALGTVAGQTGPAMDYCLTNAIEPNDDGSSRAVPTPFPIDFFGQTRQRLFVNNNGNLTFGRGMSTFTPYGLTGRTHRPIIAPFFADVDTRGDLSNVVTYGTSADGNSFCVNWADVGYYPSQTDKLDTFQVVLTRADTGAGRVAGDFDITFNYDRIRWETGGASGGSGGFGGTSAAAGYSAGTGVPGTFVQLPGSMQPGELLDDGAHSLVAGSQGSTQPGRYIFQVRNADLDATLGGLTGTVQDENGNGIEGAYVQVCRNGVRACSSLSRTDANGHYAFSGLWIGDYSISVSPPDGSALFPANGASAVSAGEMTTADAITLLAPRGAPAGVSLSNAPGSDDGVIEPYFPEVGPPVVHYRAALDFSVVGCPGVVNPTYTQTVGGVVIQDHQPLTEVSPGHYTAVIPMAYPAHGDANLSTNVPLTCDVGAQPVGFDLYIDPSGVVTDQWGRPVQGAQVTLQRSDTGTGTFSAVPDGSAVMSPANRANPATTDASGSFQWDVLTGWYQVSSAATGCDPATTSPLEVPPARLDLLVKMSCPGATVPVPTTAPVLSGTAQVGQALTATDGAWGNGIVHTKTEWLRNGNVVHTGSTYQLTPADQGHAITARVTGQRPDYTQENGTGDVVSFAETHVDLVGGTVAGAPGGGGGGGTPTPPSAPANTKAPSVGGVTKVGQTLVADPGSWDTESLSFAFQWRRDGSSIVGATSKDYIPASADLGHELSVRVTASKAGLPDGTATSEPVTVQRGDAPEALSPPVITGEAAPGHVLQVSDGSWNRDGLTFGYQWLRDGEEIADATSAAYTVTAADKGSELRAVVTATEEGYADGSATSSGVTVPAVGHPSVPKMTARLVHSVVRPGQHPKVKIRVAHGTDMVTGPLVVRVDGERVSTDRLARRDHGRMTIVLPKQAVGRHAVQVRYLGNNHLAAVSASTVLRVKPGHQGGQGRVLPVPVS